MQQEAPQPTVQIAKLPLRPQRSVANLKNISVPVNLVSNHFPVTFIDKNQVINVYAFDFDPPIEQDARRIRDDVMRSAKEEIVRQGLKEYTLRGRNIWSPLQVKERIIATGVDSQSKTSYTVRIEFVREHNFRDFAAETNNAKVSGPLLQNVNVAIKRSLKELGLIEIGRLSKFYDPRSIDRFRIQEHGIKVWRGVKTSFQVYSGCPYLQIDFASRVLRDQTALDFMSQGQNQRMNQQDMLEQMVGLSVLAAYGNFRIYRIDDINFKLTPRATFPLSDGKTISFIEYYKTKYNIQIRDDKQPLIVYRDKRNPDKITHLIPELLNMTGLTDRQRSDFRLMKDVAEYTKLEPDQRNKEIADIQVKLESALKKHNIQLTKENRITGHMLTAPSILLGKKDLKTDQAAFFILKDNDWFLVYVARGQRDDDDADFLVSELQKNGAKIGIKLEKPFFINLKDSNPNSWVREIDDAIKKGGAPQMVVSFIPDRDKERLYGALKKYCLSEFGISHQNVLLKFLKNKNPSAVASKIAQQMSVKLGFPLWAIPRPKGVSEKTMVVGIDIYHKLIAQKKSCMGFVAHLDAECLTTYSRSILMRPGQEMCQEIGAVMTQAIMAYFENNGKKYLPDTIIVYRDGVGSGQVQTLLETEIAQIKRAISNIGANYNPKFAAIMINKKINDRFFAQNANLPAGVQRGKQGTLVNPPSGTIVADKVISNNFDFFLAAQYVTQGTCTPTHYLVLENNTDWTEETFWQLTYFQCFNYQNWSGAVRVPACVQYAHKLSYLIGDTFQSNIHKKLEKLPCFL